MSNAYEQYRQTSIQTAPPEQLIVMLYDGAVRFLEQAKTALRDGDDASLPIGRAQDIMVELAGSLNRSAGPIADNLAQLYDFWIQRLFQAQIKRETAMVDEVLTMVRDLRDAWATVAIQQRRATSGAPATTALNARG